MKLKLLLAGSRVRFGGSGRRFGFNDLPIRNNKRVLMHPSRELDGLSFQPLQSRIAERVAPFPAQHEFPIRRIEHDHPPFVLELLDRILHFGVLIAEFRFESRDASLEGVYLRVRKHLGPMQ